MKLIGTNLEELRLNSPSKNLTERIEGFYKDLELENENFIEAFGGDFFLVENEVDLEEIPSTVLVNGKYSNLKVSACAYDVFEMIDENYAQVLLCTNNGGGTTYLIPKDIIENHKTVKESLELTAKDNAY